MGPFAVALLCSAVCGLNEPNGIIWVIFINKAIFNFKHT
jgi:hypothetical protein